MKAGASPPRSVAQGFCRVTAVLTPTADSHIEMEVRMPLEEWNGKFLAVGNGGWAGSITSGAMGEALREGYATASTDTGHKASETPGGSFALGHPEKLVDYGYRAVHEMTVEAKAIMAAFYGRPARLSYWNSCSNGGRQALMEAQRYPEDYDGIVAGAPAADWSGRALQSLWVAQAVHRDEASLHPAGEVSGDSRGGAGGLRRGGWRGDGVIENPTRCNFDPGVLLCKEADGAACLTAAQVETARKIYENHGDVSGAVAGERTGLGDLWRRQSRSPLATIISSTSCSATRPGTSATLDFCECRAVSQSDGRRAGSEPAGVLRARRQAAPVSRLGRSADPAAAQRRLLPEVVEAIGKVDDSYRLFMVPGMAHCGGGTGPNQFNALAAVERWRESGRRRSGFRRRASLTTRWI